MKSSRTKNRRQNRRQNRTKKRRRIQKRKSKDGNIIEDIKKSKYSKFNYNYEIDMKDSIEYNNLINEKNIENIGIRIDDLIQYIINLDLCPSREDLFRTKQNYVTNLIRIKNKYNLNTRKNIFRNKERPEKEYVQVINKTPFFIIDS